jgi:hypothetical protein
MHLISVKRAARIFSVSPRTVQIWCQNGTLPCIRIRKTLRIVEDRLPDDLRGLCTGEPHQKTDEVLEDGNGLSTPYAAT